jgi:hypothetical protein
MFILQHHTVNYIFLNIPILCLIFFNSFIVFKISGFYGRCFCGEDKLEVGNRI